MQMLWPIVLVVGANAFYNIVAKQTPEDVDPFFSLVVTYLVSMVISLLMFFITAEDKSIMVQMSRVNWTAYLFGLLIIGLEFGYIMIYRVGWKISVASLVSNIALAVILLVVGLLIYKESISPRQIAGMIVCVAGLILIGK